MRLLEELDGYRVTVICSLHNLMGKWGIGYKEGGEGGGGGRYEKMYKF